MNRAILRSVLIVWMLIACAFGGAKLACAQKPKSLFYMTREPKSVRSFLAHADKIDILVPYWYTVDANGLVTGGSNPLVLDAARQHHVPIMPLVTNAGFAQDEFHKLLKNSDAIHQFYAQLVRACKENGYIGFQLDFENVNWTDRDGLSTAVAEAAAIFHREGLQVSIATIPNAPGRAGETGFSAWMYQNWRGAYDLKALAESVDLFCLMTYDQHTVWTVPGPVTGWPWTTANLDYALKVVPAQKLSLGIPLYGYHWFSGTPVKATDKSADKPNPTADYISTEDALDLAKAYNGHVEWDSADRTAWFYFYRDDFREWIFFTDVRTFRERYDLVKQRGLAGFCSWVLGMEDPGIWELLPSHK
jgi:spore germination protein YaaH